jgi:hypothetical protein
MQFAADGVAGIERNRALAIGHGGGRVRTHKAAGGDRRHGEEAAAADGVAQALRDPAAPAAHRIVEGDRFLAAQHDAAGVMVVEPVAHARHVGDDGNAEGLQQRSRPEPGVLQKLRRVESAGGDHRSLRSHA